MYLMFIEKEVVVVLIRILCILDVGESESTFVTFDLHNDVILNGI